MHAWRPDPYILWSVEKYSKNRLLYIGVVL
nr:MAG TPA_asm: hypothetical protein [Caudoviricetes sp.]